MFKSKLYLVTVILGILTLMAGACVQPTLPETPQGNGTIIIHVTDIPPDEEVTSIMVTLSEVQVHRASIRQEKETVATNNRTQAQEQEQQLQNEVGEWITIDISGNATFDLLQIKGIEQFLGATEVRAAKYTQVSLGIDLIQVKVGSGNLTDAVLPSRELKIVQPFDVIAGRTTTLVLDFEADKILTTTGTDIDISPARAEKLIVNPVVKLTVRQENLGDQKEGK
ncbi:DUF4382 domain-containing protein [Chloroflexota bacterium]